MLCHGSLMPGDVMPIDENRIPAKGYRHAGGNRHPVKSSGFRPRIKAFRGMLTDAGMTV